MSALSWPVLRHVVSLGSVAQGDDDNDDDDADDDDSQGVL